MWWLFLAFVFVAALLVGWLWPASDGAGPVLLLTENAEASVEGIIRCASSGGRPVFVRDAGSSDATPDIVRRLAAGSSRVIPVEGDLPAVLDMLGAPVVQVIRLTPHIDIAEVLRELDRSRKYPLFFRHSR